MNPNTGHGHVHPRPDGLRVRCGGPAVCTYCAADYVIHNRRRITPTPLVPLPPTIQDVSGQVFVRED